MAEGVRGQTAHAAEGSIKRIRDLNDRIVDSARRSGEASLQAYERFLSAVAQAQEATGERTAGWLEAVGKAQASFTRELANASPDALRAVGERFSEVASAAARQARRVPGEPKAEGEARGTVARQEDLPIARYDSLSASEIVSRLGKLSEVDRGKVDAYERKHKARKTVLNKIEALQS